MAFFFAAVQRPKTLSPARWMTASNPSRASGSRRAPGCHSISGAPDSAGRRTRRMTRSPRATNAGISALPTSPEAPLMRTFMRRYCTRLMLVRRRGVAGTMLFDLIGEKLVYRSQRFRIAGGDAHPRAIRQLFVGVCDLVRELLHLGSAGRHFGVGH